MVGTILFIWNKSTYEILPVYSSTTPLGTKNEYTVLLTTDVNLSCSVAVLTTTLQIINTSISNFDIESVTESYTFITKNGNNSLGDVIINFTYDQIINSGPITTVSNLTGVINASGIYRYLDNQTGIIEFDNVSGVRTLTVL
jgi:hypothetical protein